MERDLRLVTQAMIDEASGFTRTPEQPPLPGMDVLMLIEGMSPEDRASFRQFHLDRMAESEQLLFAVDRVNEAEGRG